MKNKILFLMLGMLLLGVFFIGNVSAGLWDDGLKAYYKLDETSGTTAEDSSVNKNNSIASSDFVFNSSVAGKINTGADFSTRNNDYINLSGTPLITTPFSVSLWAKRDNATTTIGLITSKRAGAFTYYVTGNKSKFDADAVVNIVTGVVYIKTEWTHLVATYGMDGNASLYVNGTLDTTVINNVTINSTVAQHIGDVIWNGRGLIDEVGIWNRTLNSNEIKDLYNNGDGLAYGESGTSAPSISVNLTSPSNNSIISTSNQSFSVNLTMSGTNYSYQWKNNTYTIWFNNGTLFKTNFTNGLSGNQTNISTNISGFTLGNYLWNSYACYENTTFSNCSWATNNFTFQYRPYSETAVSFNNSVLETSGQTYILNITSISTVTSVIAVLMHNGSSYTSTVTSLGSGNYKISNLIDVPLQNSGVSSNKSFYWTLTFGIVGNSNFVTNSTTYSQQVNRTYLTNCNATYPHQFINFSTKSAENPFPTVNATFKSAWTWFIKGGTGSITRNYTFEDVTETKSTWAFCGNYNNTFVSKVNIEYDGVLYALNSYFLENAELTNTTNYINLYLLNNTKATATVLKVRDNIQNPIEDVLIQIQLYDVGTDTFYTVGMGKTSFTGEDLAYLNWYDSLYRFILIKDGVVIKMTNTTKIFETPQIFDILSTTTFSYEKFRDFVYSLTYNPITQNFILTFTKPSGLVEQGCLRVIKRTAKNDTEIYLVCESSSSATLYANIGGYGNGTYIAAFYATGSWALIDTLSYLVGSNSFGDKIFSELGFEDATFYAILFSGIVVSMFLITPALAILGMLLGLLGAMALGFTVIDYSIFIGIAIVGGLIIWFAKR